MNQVPVYYQLHQGQWVKYHGGDATYQVKCTTIIRTGHEDVQITRNNKTYTAKASQLTMINPPAGDTHRRYPIVTKETEDRIKKDILKRYGIERIIYNDPATIVYFNDGSKHVVKTSPNDVFNHRDGVLMCVIQHLTANQKIYRVLKKDIFNKIEAIIGK
jgi:hypothetical protein